LVSTLAEADTLPAALEIHPDQLVSIDIGDQTLSGVGESEASLREGLELPTAPTPDKPTRGRKRIDQLTYEAGEAKREADAARKEAADLKAQIEALRQPAQQQQPQQPAPVHPQAQPAAAKFAFPSFDQWIATHPDAASAPDAYEQWNDAKIDARTEWKLQSGQYVSQQEFDARLRQSIEADRASRTFADAINASRDAARKVHPDFDAVLSSVNDILFQPPVLELIGTAPNSGLLQYRLASNRPLAEKIAKMQNLGLVGFELAQLMADSAVASSASTATPVVNVPPPPMQPVGSGSKTTVLSASDLADKGGEDYDASGFREQLRKDRGRR
jgi:hypothetical protein